MTKGVKRIGIKACRIWFFLSVLCLLLSSAAVILIPFVTFDQTKGKPLYAYLTGAAIWGFMLLGYGLFIGLACATKQHRKKGDKTWGIFRVFSNPEATAADLLLLLSLIAFVLLCVLRYQNSLLVCSTLAVLLLSLHLHGLLNGRVYQSIRTRPILNRQSHKKEQ